MYFNRLEATVDPLVTEILEANPNKFGMDNVFQHDRILLQISRKLFR